MKTRIFNFLMTLVLCLGVFLPSYAVQPLKSSSFSDVGKDHWAYDYVEKANREGWVTGIGNGLFGVDNQVTFAEFTTMLMQAFYSDDLAQYTGPTSPWYARYCNTANELGLYWISYMTNLVDCQSDSAVKQPITRYEMAQMVYNVLDDYHIGIGAWWDYDFNDVIHRIPDWDSVPGQYQSALIRVNVTGVISGIDDQGTFGGTGYVTRGQAAVVLSNIHEIIPINRPLVPLPERDRPSTLKNGKEATIEHVSQVLQEIRMRYPTGTVWSDPQYDPNTLYNPNPVSKTVNDRIMARNVDTKYGCGGFAAMVSDLIFSENMEMRYVTDIRKVRPGDIILKLGTHKIGQYSIGVQHVMVATGCAESYMNHSVLVTDEEGYVKSAEDPSVTNYGYIIPFADGNSNHQVSWDTYYYGYQDARKVTSDKPTEICTEIGTSNEDRRPAQTLRIKIDNPDDVLADADGCFQDSLGTKYVIYTRYPD